MSDKNKSERTIGWVQAGLVLVFIIGSIAISQILAVQKELPKTQEREDRIQKVDVIVVHPGKHRISFDTTGVVRARSEVEIVPQVSGRVVQINPEFFQGGAFDKDEVVFQIEPQDFVLEVQRLEAEIAREKTALELQEAEAQAAVIEWKEVNPDQKVPALVAREPQMAEAEANLMAAEAQLGIAKLNLERAAFSFPFKGRVVESNLELGQFVNAGQSYGRVFDVGALEVQMSLEDQQLKWLLSSDDQAQKIIKADYLGKTRSYEGVLKRGAASLDNETRFGTVNLGFKNPPDDLIPGVFATVSVIGFEEDNVSVLPLSVLQERNLVWKVDDRNTLQRTSPDILYINDSEVTLKGLEEGDRIVTGRISGGSNNTKVKIRSTEEVQYPKPGSARTDSKGVIPKLLNSKGEGEP